MNRGFGLFVALGLLAGPALASDLVNGSFEDGPVTTSWARVQMSGPLLPGWQITADNLDHIGTLWQPADGARSLELNGNMGGAISQLIATIVGQEYVLRFALSGNWGGPDIKRLEVGAGSTVQEFSVHTAGNTGLNMGWSDEQVPFVATDLTTAISFRSLETGFHGAAIDNVRIELVPAPAAGALLLGLLGVGRTRRR